MKIVFGFVLGVGACLSIEYMIATVLLAMRYLNEKIAKEKSISILDVVLEKHQSMAAFLVVSLMIVNVLIVFLAGFIKAA